MEAGNLRTRVKGLLATRQVLAYPKCGNTWLRLMMFKAQCEEHGASDEGYLSDYHVSLGGLPNVMWSHGTKHRRDLVGNRNVDPNLRRRRRTLFLIRDPRDALVSCYYHEVYRNGPEVYSPEEWSEMFAGASIEDRCPPIEAYARSNTRGIDYLIHFYNHWVGIQQEFKAFQIVRYEDLRADPVLTLSAAMSFLMLPVSPAAALAAVEYSSFDNMRQLELANTMPQADLSGPAEATDSRGFKVRKGVVGGYVDELDEGLVEYVDRAVEERLNPVFGYSGKPRNGTA